MKNLKYKTFVFKLKFLLTTYLKTKFHFIKEVKLDNSMPHFYRRSTSSNPTTTT